MRYSTKHYAKALFLILSDKPAHERKEILQRFVRAISRRGEVKNLGLILKDVEKLYFKKSGFKKVSLESTNPVSEELKKEIKAILGDKSLVLEKVNPGLLAGIKILVNNELLVDASAKSQLRRLFRSS